MNKKFISWRRVSTFRQSKSGLGLEAQKEIIRYFIERENGKWLADYSECYTGTDLEGCVALRKAMNHAKRENAILIIAKTDRFRNTIEALQVYENMGEGNIMFCDLPHTDKFTLTLFFALAEREALIVSIRTKQALAVKKAQGTKLGAASETYRNNRAQKSAEEREEIARKKGNTRTRRYLESRDVQALCKILRRTFPDACEGDVSGWDWSRINTHRENRLNILRMMDDVHAMNTDIFAKWDFSDIESVQLQVKLASLIRNIRTAVLRNN